MDENQKMSYDRLLTCEVKTGYKDENSVKAKGRTKSVENGLNLYFYQCKFCGNFHLTKRKSKMTKPVIE